MLQFLLSLWSLLYIIAFVYCIVKLLPDYEPRIVSEARQAKLEAKFFASVAGESARSPSTWLQPKAKIRAVRYFLSITDPDLKVVRDKFIKMRYFRTSAAAAVFDNPFGYHNGDIYVLSKIAAWADVVFPCKWWLYATDFLAPELKKCIEGKSFKQVGEGDIEPIQYDIALNENRVLFTAKRAHDMEVSKHV
jgi:hypothetical protein